MEPTIGWMVTKSSGVARFAAGQDVLHAVAVAGKVVGDGANQGELVGQLSVQGQQFADIEAGHLGADRLEVAAIFGRGVRLHVVRFHVRRPARQPQEDHRGVRRGSPGFLRGRARTSRFERPAPPRASEPSLRNSRRDSGPGQAIRRLVHGILRVRHEQRQVVHAAALETEPAGHWLVGRALPGAGRSRGAPARDISSKVRAVRRNSCSAGGNPSGNVSSRVSRPSATCNPFWKMPAAPARSWVGPRAVTCKNAFSLRCVATYLSPSIFHATKAPLLSPGFLGISCSLPAHSCTRLGSRVGFRHMAVDRQEREPLSFLRSAHVLLRPLIGTCCSASWRCRWTSSAAMPSSRPCTPGCSTRPSRWDRSCSTRDSFPPSRLRPAGRPGGGAPRRSRPRRRTQPGGAGGARGGARGLAADRRPATCTPAWPSCRSRPRRFTSRCPPAAPARHRRGALSDSAAACQRRAGRCLRGQGRRTEPRGGPQGDPGCGTPITPRAGRASCARRRSPAGWSIRASCRSTAWASTPTAGRTTPCASSRATVSRRPSNAFTQPPGQREGNPRSPA